MEQVECHRLARKQVVEQSEPVYRLIFPFVAHSFLGILESLLHQEVLSGHFTTTDHVPVFSLGGSCWPHSFLFAYLHPVHGLEQSCFPGESIVASTLVSVYIVFYIFHKLLTNLYIFLVVSIL